MKRICAICAACAALLTLKIEIISWAALVILLWAAGAAVFIRAVDERERRYE